MQVYNNHKALLLDVNLKMGIAPQSKFDLSVEIIYHKRMHPLPK